MARVAAAARPRRRGALNPKLYALKLGVGGLNESRRISLRLALISHVDIPREGEIDHLIEAEKLFAPAQPKAAKKLSAKATNKSANAKTKSTNKKGSKRVAA